MSWRPGNWKYGAWQKDERFLRNPSVVTEERLYNAYEAGADAMLKALKQSGKYIDASKYPYGLILNEIIPVQKLERSFKGWLIVIPEGV